MMIGKPKLQLEFCKPISSTQVLNFFMLDRYYFFNSFAVKGDFGTEVVFSAQADFYNPVLNQVTMFN